MQGSPLRAAAAACQPGCVAIVLDETGCGALEPGKRPLLVVAAMRSCSQPAFLELNVKKAEAQSMLRRLGVVTEPPAKPPPSSVGEQEAASGAAGSSADAVAPGAEPDGS